MSAGIGTSSQLRTFVVTASRRPAQAARQSDRKQSLSGRQVYGGVEPRKVSDVDGRHFTVQVGREHRTSPARVAVDFRYTADCCGDLQEAAESTKVQSG